MPEAGGQRDRKAWLLGVHLPRVYVERGGHAASLEIRQCVPYQSVREDAKVGAATSREVPPQRPEGGGGELRKPTCRPSEPVRIPPPAGVPIAGAPDRKETGIVQVAFLHQDVERPFPPWDDGKARGSKSYH